MNLPQTMRFMKFGWIVFHAIVIPLIFIAGFLFCSLLSVPPASP